MTFHRNLLLFFVLVSEQHYRALAKYYMAAFVMRSQSLTDPKQPYQGLHCSATHPNEKLSHSCAHNRWQAGSQTHLSMHHPGRSMDCTDGLRTAMQRRQGMLQFQHGGVLCFYATASKEVAEL